MKNKKVFNEIFKTGFPVQKNVTDVQLLPNNVMTFCIKEV